MHEHFAVIDRKIVWYGSVNLLSNAREEDNLMRVKRRGWTGIYGDQFSGMIILQIS